MPKAVEQLGIAYTPVEIVDFINHSVAEIMRREFGRSLADEGVHILDPFSGTGTFITRLIQSGLLGDSLERKYQSEIHANEITLLAYYIANVNIENAYHAMLCNISDYKSFNGICLTDTFQLYEPNNENLLPEDRLKKNTDRVEEQKQAKIKVIIGNPPYSVGQKSANDNAQNKSYPYLENRIAMTYANKSNASLLKSLYDSYIKAFRWASDRLDKEAGGVIAFVSTAGWLDGNAMDGMRKCLAEEFSKIYVFNLRGNQRTSGELSKREGGKIFGSGSRSPIAMTFLIKNPTHQGPAEIFYHDIGDYLSREQKIDIITQKPNIYDVNITWDNIIPNEHGDWLNKRNEQFDLLIPLSNKKDKYNLKTFFLPVNSNGLLTARDRWCYNFSQEHLKININEAINNFNEESGIFKTKFDSNKNIKIEDIVDFSANKFAWDRQQKKDIIAHKLYSFDKYSLFTSLYRPFVKQNVYFNRSLNNCVYLLPQLLPKPSFLNSIICVSGIGVTKEFSTIITNLLPDFELIGKSQCFPLYYYTEDAKPDNRLFPNNNTIDGYIRHNAINDYILKDYNSLYGKNLAKIDVFYYVYGLLHSEDYRTTFDADLRKTLPRLPLVDNASDFWSFSKAGRELAELHLNYETIAPYDQAVVTGAEKGDFTIDKIRFLRKDDKTVILYNKNIKIVNIPLKAYDYVVNGRSPIEWIIDQYQVKIDEKTGIKNDPNDWAREHDQPRYILDLILRVITVSLETMKIVKSLPRLDFS
jgi:predicted helicase